MIVLDGMRLPNPINRRDHWRTKSKRTKAQVQELDLVHRRTIESFELPVRVTMTRVSRQLVDDDNLGPCFKHIRDYLATALLPELTQANQYYRRGDDSDPRIQWAYRQRRGEYAVEIELETINDHGT